MSKTVYHKIDEKAYDNTKPFPRQKTPQATAMAMIDAYNAEQARLYEMFYQDICIEAKVNPDNPNSRKLLKKVYGENYAYDLYGVATAFNDLVEFVKDLGVNLD